MAFPKPTLTFGIRLIFVILILVAIMYGVLSYAAKSREPLRLGLQDYLAKATGLTAQITDLPEASLVPNIAFHLKGIALQSLTEPPRTVLSVGDAIIAKSFLHTMFGIQKIGMLELRDVQVASGYVLPQKLTLSFAGISDPNPAKTPASFLLDGRYNDQDLLVTAYVTRHTGRHTYSYSLPDRSPVSLKIGELEASGALEFKDKSLDLVEVVLSHTGGEATFNLTDFHVNPLSGTLVGAINEVPVKGLLTQKGDSRVLSVTPLTTKPADEKMVRNFVQTLNAHFGTEKDKTGFYLETLAGQSPQPDIKKQDDTQ